MPRRLLPLFAFLVTACAPAATPELAPLAPSKDLLYIQEGDRIVLRHAATGEARAQVPWGAPDPGWETVYSRIDLQDRRTVVHAHAMGSDRTRWSVELKEHFVIPTTGMSGRPAGMSADGRTLVLSQRVLESPSRFALLDTTFERPPHYLELPGRFTYDAISPDGRSIYLIEYFDPDGGHDQPYGVRVYDRIEDKVLTGYIADKANGHERMRGTRVEQIATPDGSWAYTLYENHHHGPFIHALDTRNLSAICIDLPDAPRGQDWTMVLSPDGQRLLAANWSAGKVIEVDLKNFKAKRSLSLPQPWTWLPQVPVSYAKPHYRQAVAISPDGATLYVVGPNKGVTAVDTREMKVKATLATDWGVESIAISPDGSRLYGVHMGHGRLLHIDTRTGNVASAVTLRWSPQSILRVS